jgi:hypothetical protein
MSGHPIYIPTLRVSFVITATQKNGKKSQAGKSLGVPVDGTQVKAVVNNELGICSVFMKSSTPNILERCFICV